MNKTLSDYSKQQIKYGLAKLPEDWQHRFKLIYSHKDPSKSIDDVVDAMPDEKLDWAMQQVERSLIKYQKNG